MADPLGRFRRLIAIPTMSGSDETLTDWPRFDEFIDALDELYPRVAETLQKEKIAGFSLLYRWPGTEQRPAATAHPAVLMAHYDVVAATDEGWDHPPSRPS